MDRRWLLMRAYMYTILRFVSLANGNIKDIHVDVPRVQMPI